MFFFASFALLYLFITSNSVVFVDRGRKTIPCPRAQGSLATPLATRDGENRFTYGYDHQSVPL